MLFFTVLTKELALKFSVEGYCASPIFDPNKGLVTATVLSQVQYMDNPRPKLYLPQGICDPLALCCRVGVAVDNRMNIK